VCFAKSECESIIEQDGDVMDSVLRSLNMLKLAMSDTYSDFEEKMKKEKSKHARYQLTLRKEMIALRKSIRAQEDAILDIEDGKLKQRMTSAVERAEDRLRAIKNANLF